MNALTFTTAERKSTNALIAVIGPSGSGKTMSALLMARGLVGQEGKFGVIDTENRRATFYSDVCAPWMHLDLSPPFAPSRYIDAIDAAEKAGLGAVVIDSASHEWEGIGGVCEMADEIEARSGKSGLHCWNKPKREHKRLMHRLMQAQLHVIFCLRSKTPSKQIKRGGKTEIVEQPPEPVCEKGFIYEMTVSVMLERDTHFPQPYKVPVFLEKAFPPNKVITSEAGALIRQWCEAGKPVDPHAEHVLRVARDVASMGLDALRQHWSQVKADHPDDVRFLRSAQAELESIAREADRFAQMAADAAAPHSDTMTLQASPDEDGSSDIEPETPFDEPEAVA